MAELWLILCLISGVISKWMSHLINSLRYLTLNRHQSHRNHTHTFHIALKLWLFSFRHIYWSIFVMNAVNAMQNFGALSRCLVPCSLAYVTAANQAAWFPEVGQFQSLYPRCHRRTECCQLCLISLFISIQLSCDSINMHNGMCQW